MLRFSVGAVQGLPLAHVFSAFFINPLKYSAAEAAVRLQAKSLRSEGASIQGMCSAEAVFFVLLTGVCR